MDKTTGHWFEAKSGTCDLPINTMSRLEFRLFISLWKLNKILNNFFSFSNEPFSSGDCAKWKDMFQTKTGRKLKRSIWRRNTQWKNVKLRLGLRLWGLAALQFGPCCNFETRLDQIQAARSESRTTKVYFVNFKTHLALRRVNFDGRKGQRGRTIPRSVSRVGVWPSPHNSLILSKC